MNYYETAIKKIEQMLAAAGSNKDELCKKIGISSTAMDFFLSKKIRLPADIVNKIYLFLDKEEKSSRDLRDQIDTDTTHSSDYKC